MTTIDNRYLLKVVVRGRADCVGTGLQVRDAAASLGWSSRRAEELSLVLVELANNAVRHAGGGTCEVEIDANRASVTVHDRGHGFPRWVLEQHAMGGSVEARPAAARSTGLGAGLDSATRLSQELILHNPTAGGARARATCYRISPKKGGTA